MLAVNQNMQKSSANRKRTNYGTLKFVHPPMVSLEQCSITMAIFFAYEEEQKIEI